MKKLTFMITLGCITYASCIKKVNTDTCPAGPESPLNGFIANSNFNGVAPLRQQSVPTDEIGFTFRPKVNGRITAFKLKVPNTVSDVPVTLWDGTSKMKIKTVLMNTNASDAVATTNITPIEVLAGATYVISMNSNNSYDYFNTNAGTAYPISVCNIDVLNCCYNFGFGTAYPGGVYANTKFRAGVDFIFEPNK
jgi:hypothetical protein